jgi:hypothetical protein
VRGFKDGSGRKWATKIFPAPRAFVAETAGEEIMRVFHLAVGLLAVAACSMTEPAWRGRIPQESRPGLGTSWGETRSSPIREIPFLRGSETPFARATLLYDDRDGVAAMTGRDDPDDATTGSGVEAVVVDERGRPLDTVWSAGRIYVVGKRGQRYALRIRNRTAGRVEVVASVDGLDVIDGLRASLRKRGYIIEPHATVTIDGFRRNLAEVAAFRFGAVSDSYAARTGDDSNVGVIGMAFYSEWGVRLPDEDRSDEAERRHAAQPFSDARFAQPPPG